VRIFPRQSYLLLVVAIVVGVTLGSTSNMLAHAIENSGFVHWTQQAHCTWGRALFDHGNGGGQARAEAVSRNALIANQVTMPCQDWLARPAGFITAKYQVFKNNGGNWQLCGDSNWAHNGAPGHSLIVVSNDWGNNPLCGAGEYRTHAGSFVNVNNAWHGGWIHTTPGHHLP
jgi:hypothetical protein